MPGEEEGRDLVHHLAVVEAAAALGIGGGHDLGGEVVGRGAVGDRRPAVGDQRLDQAADAAGGGAGAARMRPQPGRQRQDRGEVDQRLRVLVLAEGGEHLRRGPVLDRHREQRAEDHVGGGVAGLGLDVDLAPGLRLEPCDRGAAGVEHRREGVAQPPALEGRVDDPPRPCPRGAIGDEDRIAEQRREPGLQPPRFRKVAGTGLEDQLDQRGVVADEAVNDGRAEFGHPGPVEPRRQGREQVAAEGTGEAEHGAAAVAADGLGRDHAVALSAALRSTERCRLTARVMRPGECGRPAKRSASVSGPAVMAK